MVATVNRASYLRELERLREHLNTIVEQAFVATDLPGADVSAPGSWSPAVDLFETEAAYVLTAEVPGMTRDDLDLEIEGRRLVLSGRRKPPGEGGNFHRMERHHGPFRRAFELDHAVDPEDVRADLESGVLTVRLSKSGGGRRRIEVANREDSNG